MRDCEAYRLDERFRLISKGLAANSLTELSDGSLLGLINGRTVSRSRDEAITWEPVCQLDRVFRQPASLKIRDGQIVWVCKDPQSRTKRWNSERMEFDYFTLDSWFMRTSDEGKSWACVQKLAAEYPVVYVCSDLIETKEGAVVIPVTLWQSNPGRLVTCTYVTHDTGHSWHRSNIIDLGGNGNHDGVQEATLTELTDGRLLMLLRTGWDRFWEAVSWNGGYTWQAIRPSRIPSSSSPGFLQRLRSGRLVLVWNCLRSEARIRPLCELRPDRSSQAVRSTDSRNYSQLPADWFREELSIAFSEDEGETWTRPLVFVSSVEADYQLDYPQVWERRDGEIWISFLERRIDQLNLVRVMERDLMTPQGSVR